MEKTFDLLAMGRSSIDLYSNDIGAPFPEIKSFGAFVGGCPTNISVGTRRLGLKSALLTAVGEDPVGDFVLRFLNQEGVDTRYIPKKPGFRTSAVLLGIQPPDQFPLVFYRNGCADIELNHDDVCNAPLEQCRILLITGTGLSREPSRSATIFAAERAKKSGAEVFLDIDFRADQWEDPTAQWAMIIHVMEQYMRVAVQHEIDMIFMLEHFCGHGYRRDDPSGACYRGLDAELWFDLTCIHPNPAGHSEIADMFLAVVQE